MQSKSLDADWGIAELPENSIQILHEFLNNKDSVLRMLQSVREDERLFDLCEQLPWCDKVVLHDSADYRLRLHLFLPGYEDRPHSHRWSFSSVILSGNYTHFIYGVDTELVHLKYFRELRPLLIRDEKAGSTYSMHHSLVHSFKAEPYTLSIILRGPSVKEKSLIIDTKDNTINWKYGSNQEEVSTVMKHKMTKERLDFVIHKVNELLYT